MILCSAKFGSSYSNLGRKQIDPRTLQNLVFYKTNELKTKLFSENLSLFSSESTNQN